MVQPRNEEVYIGMSRRDEMIKITLEYSHSLQNWLSLYKSSKESSKESLLSEWVDTCYT